MSFYKLIINNVLRSARTYGSYFLASTFSVFVFFTFAMLTFHPQMKSGINGSSDTVSKLANLGMIASQVLIVLLSIIFLWYSFWTFVKARKRDLGIYLMLGMKVRDLRKILFGENMLIGAASITSGVGLGLLFTKVILIVISDILGILGGLKFYFPTIGILLTVGIFLVLYLLISIVMTLRIETENLTQLGKSDETPRPIPFTHPLLVVLAAVTVFGGYFSLWHFIYRADGNQMYWLLACVLLTVLGTFLFFHQVLVYTYKIAKKRSSYWQNTKLIQVAEGIYKAKENATMYALIACTASVALVGICATTALGSSETGSRNAVSAAYVIRHQETTDLKEDSIAIGNEVTQILDKYQEDYTSNFLTSYQLENFPVGKNPADWSMIDYVVKASDFNQVAKSLGIKALHPKEKELIQPATSTSEEETYQKSSTEKLRSHLMVKVADDYQKVTVNKVSERFKIANMSALYVASDDFVDQLQNNADADYSSLLYQIIDLKNWRTADKANTEILRLFHQKQQAFDDKMRAIDADEEMTDDQRAAAWEENYVNNNVDYDSRYETWQAQRQSNGLILMIGILLGGVFFIFTASIMYFRLFGDLDKEGRYHRSLYQIGLQPKKRHQIVTKQMAEMFFVPMIISIIHSSVAFWGIVSLAGVNLWHYFFLIIGCYFLLMLILFLICRWRYLVHLDLRAENSQAF